MRLLLVEPWLHGSHLRWAEGYRAASRHEVHVIGLPGGRWRWLLRGGAVIIADLVERWVDEHGLPDLLLVSGMVDVAQLLGLTRRRLTPSPPVVIYQHESQLLYPGRRAGDDEAALRNWMSWCAADLVVFNSTFHRDAIVGVLPRFLERQPEPSHRHWFDRVVDRFDVLPVGVDLAPFLGAIPGRLRDRAEIEVDGAPVVLWPHRWEPDKDPAAFESAVAKLVGRGLPFRLVLAGEDPPNGSGPAAGLRSQMGERFNSHVLAVGPFERGRYVELVGRADVVVSCAHHEFFGVATVEAMAAGCRPVVPDDLAYPELIPAEYHQETLYRRGRFGTALLDAVESAANRRRIDEGLATSMARFDWSVVAQRYDDRFEGLA